MVAFDKILFGLFLVIPLIICFNAQDNMIYVLQWNVTSEQAWANWTFWYFEMGQESFTSRNCDFQNCFITYNRSFLRHIEDFDVILFNIVYYPHNSESIPQNRSNNQLYIFVASEPAALNPIKNVYAGFFNFTWTYKFNSDIFHPFYVVKNRIGEVVGPKRNPPWVDISTLPPTKKYVVRKILNKTIAAAWVTAHCTPELRRSVFVTNLYTELSKYGHKIDSYGQCGTLFCARKPNERVHVISNCYKKIESKYYFYLAFENSFCEDYVTEKVLHGYHHYTVPIVYGAADYSRYPKSLQICY